MSVAFTDGIFAEGTISDVLPTIEILQGRMSKLTAIGSHATLFAELLCCPHGPCSCIGAT